MPCAVWFREAGAEQPPAGGAGAAAGPAHAALTGLAISKKESGLICYILLSACCDNMV